MILLSRYEKGHLNAGPKAKTDVEIILKNEYNAKIITISETLGSSKIKHIYYKILAFVKPFFIKNTNELTIIQFPFSNYKFPTRRLKNKIAFIHDINGLRYNDIILNRKEIAFLSDCKYIVAHNNKMKEYLIENGISKDKIYTNELFDYLCNDFSKDNNFDRKNIKIAYAGNLSKEKSPFLYQIDKSKINYTIMLYGVGINKDINNKEKYVGKYNPDELPQNLMADFGLVWDGNFDDSDSKKGFKNYTKYNNPHKLSCYIAAGIPVIVWSKAACSDFVLKNKIGYVIDNLYDINNLDLNRYEEYLKNILKIKKKVITGYYTQKVLDEIIKKVK